MEIPNLNIKHGLCLSLGANIDSRYGTPIESLIKSKTKVENIIINLLKINYSKEVLPDNLFNWSSLYQTKPFGTLENQPDYINCLLLVKGEQLPKASKKKAKTILKEFQNLEKEYGRDKFSEDKIWLPRPLDIDILWWDNLSINDKELILPHPRFISRNFVISPLSEELSKTQEIKKLHVKNWIIN